MSMLELESSQTTLVVVDFQDKLAAAMPVEACESATRNTVRLIEGARRLEVPVVVTEQYPKGLGPTVAPIREALEGLSPPPRRVEKMDFDACRGEGFTDALQGKSVVLAGLEAHICVWQTTRSLAAHGYAVHVASDATCSRHTENHRIAEGLWRQAGALVSCTESVLFDLVGRAGTDTFKAISKLVKS